MPHMLWLRNYSYLLQLIVIDCRKLLTKAKPEFGVSLSAPPATTDGTVATHGLIMDRSARDVTSWCTPTTSDHWTSLVYIYIHNYKFFYEGLFHFPPTFQILMMMAMTLGSPIWVTSVRSARNWVGTVVVHTFISISMLSVYRSLSLLYKEILLCMQSIQRNQYSLIRENYKPHPQFPKQWLLCRLKGALGVVS